MIECQTTDADCVSVIPKPKAGGAFASVANRNFSNPVIVERIVADAGMDIGDTLMGDHLRKVAVPLMLSVSKVGG